MNERQVGSLLKLLFLVVIAAVIITWLTNLNTTKINGTILPFVTSDISTIEIISGSTTITLKKTDSAWMVNDFIAESSIIESFLSTLSKSKVLELSSTNAENFAIYQVGEGSNIVNFTSKNNQKSSVRFGKSGTGTKTYIRYDSENEVYLAEGTYNTYIQNTVAMFRTRSMTDFTADNVTKITNGKVELNLNDNGNWVASGLNESEMNSFTAKIFVENAVNTRALTVGTDEEQLNVRSLPSSYKVTLTSKSGTENSYTFIKFEDRYYAIRSTDMAVVQVTSSFFDNLNKDLSYFKK